MSVIFKKVRYKNFLSTGNYFNEIELNSYPMTLLSGKNGEGKSTFGDALAFGLYGRPYRNINKPTLVNSINQKDCLVEVEFQVGKDSYMVRRGIKPNIFEIYQNGNLVNQSSKSKDYQKYLEQNIIKLNYSSFTQIVFLGSGGFIPFMELPAMARREVIEDLLDIKVFSKMNVIVKQRLAETQATSLTLESQINLLNEQIKLHKQYQEKQKEDREKQAEELRLKVKESQDSVFTLQSEIQYLEKDVDALQAKIKDAPKVSKKIGEMNQIRNSLNSKKDRITKTIQFYDTTSECSTCKQQITQEFRQSIVDQEKKKQTEIDDVQAKLEMELDATIKRQSEIDTIQQEISGLQSQISEKQNSIAVAQKYTKQLLEQVTKVTDSKNQKQIVEIDTIEKDLLAKKASKDSLITAKHNLETLQVLLKDTGIKSKIIRQYLPVMNKLINHYLGLMDFFVNFTLNENFEEVIKSRHRDEFTYASFSEGEKQKIDIALLLTWREVARIKNSANTNLLVLDEVFDKSLDQTSIDEATKLFRSLSSKTNIFVISHRADIHTDRFDNNIVFQKTGDFSVIQ